MRSHSQYIMGIMSGTSCDGMDIAIMEVTSLKLIYFNTYPLPYTLKEPIIRLATPGMDEIDALGALDRALGVAFAEAAVQAIKDSGIARQNILALASHGQTIRHRPNPQHHHDAFTLQIACPATIAEITGLTVISDFRRQDIAAGGQGAPLVPFAHTRMFPQAKQGATAILNIGGIANITMFYRDGHIEGFDTGPGNMLMDALMLDISDGRHAYDQNGDVAAQGTVCEPLLADLLSHAFFQKKLPKSTGREDFGQHVLDKILAWPDLSDADRMATSCALTVQSIAQSVQLLHETPEQWLVCGGGALNTHMMNTLKTTLSPAAVTSTETWGVHPDAVEALAFAILGTYTLLGQHNILSSVTGATHDSCGGHITPGRNWGDVLKWIHDTSHDKYLLG